MTITNTLTADNIKNVIQLMTPSWLSSLVAVIAGLLVSVGVVVAFYFTNTGLQQQLMVLQQTSTPTPSLSLPGSAPIVPKSTLQDNIPILLLYAFVGLAIYYVAISIVTFVQEIAELEHETTYVHAHPHELIRGFIERLVLRLVTLIVWLGFSEFFVQRILPYSVTAGHASAANVWSVQGIEYLVVAFVLVAISVQMHASFLRVITGRTRVFTS